MAMAAFGAVGGVGAATADVAAKDMAAQREAGLMRLKEQFESETQQKTFGEQEKLQGKTQAFEQGQEETRLKAASAAAGAERTFKGSEAEKHEAAATERTKITAASRVEARKAGMAPPKAEKTWTKGSYNMTPVPDGKGGFTPGGSVQTYQHNSSGRVFVQAGDKFLLHDETKPGLPNLAGVRNAKPEAVQDLMSDPNGTTPSGQTKADAFLDAYHYLPGGYFDAVRRGSATGPAGGPLGKNAPAGSKYQEQESFGGGGNAPGDQQDAEDDAEDYANTGDAGPQASDNEPAK